MRQAVLVALAMICGAAAEAQTLATQGPPAEVPPAGYSAPQYVDSRGCVYVRAGIGDLVNWVPRVNLERKHLCGFAPSLTVKPAPQPVKAPIITIPSPEPTASPGARAIPVPAAPALVPRSPRVIAAPVLTKAKVCEGKHGVLPGYVVAGTRAPVDCGPAPVALSAGQRAQLCLLALEQGQTQAVTEEGGQITCVRSVKAKKGRLSWPAPPRGYERVFTDGRLNPNRGIIRVARSDG